MSDETEFDLQTEFDRTVERVQETIAGCKSIMDTALDAGNERSSRVSAAIEHYHAPEARRARLIQKAAKDLETELSDSRSAVVNFTSVYGLTAVRAQQALLAVRRETVETGFRTLRLRGRDPLLAVVELNEELQAAEIELDLSLLQGIVVGNSLIRSATEAGLWLHRWDRSLADYLKQVPDTTEISLLKAAWQEWTDEGYFGIAEKVLVELVGLSSPIGAAVVRIGRLAVDLRRKAAELEHAQGRNDVDEMLDLAEDLTIQREAIVTVEELLDQSMRLAQLPAEPG